MTSSPRKVLRKSVILSSSRVMLSPSAVVRVFIWSLLVEKVVRFVEFVHLVLVAFSGIRNAVARSEVTKPASPERSLRPAPAMTIGLRGEFCAEDIQTFNDGR